MKWRKDVELSFQNTSAPGAILAYTGNGYMYDVVHVNGSARPTLLAAEVPRDAAVRIARLEASRRRIGRMFLAGSEPTPRGEVILIVEAARRAA